MATRKSMMDIEQDPNVFSKIVTYFDLNGRIVKKDPYVAYVIEGEQYFERPVGSGNLFKDNNQVAGRLIKRDKPDPRLGPWRVDADAKHIAFTPRPEGDDLAQAYDAQKERMFELEKELQQIKKERERK